MTREQCTEAILYEIAAGERIVWQGKPVQGVLSTWYDVIFIPIRIAIFTGLCYLFYIKLISETLSMFVAPTDSIIVFNYTFLTYSDFRLIAPMPSILQSMS